MRRLTRIDRSIDRILIRSTLQTAQPYRCLACRNQTTCFSTSSSQRTEKIPFREKLRLKLLGESNAAVVGDRDPYSGPSQLSTSLPQKEPERQEEPEVDHYGGYEPADTWHGLEEIGPDQESLEQRWDEKHPFRSFSPRERVKSSVKVTAALRRAIVEVFALQRARIPLLKFQWRNPGLDRTLHVQITPSASGATLQFAKAYPLERIVKSLGSSRDRTESKVAVIKADEYTKSTPSKNAFQPESGPVIDEKVEREPSKEIPAADCSTVDDLDAKSPGPAASRDPSWLEIRLADPVIKFAILKRTLQLTGIRIPDHLINSLNTAKALLNHLTTPSKPARVAEALAQKEDLITLPNVRVVERKISSIDKEQMIGRWKIIKKELQERGLPVTGA